MTDTLPTPEPVDALPKSGGRRNKWLDRIRAAEDGRPYRIQVNEQDRAKVANQIRSGAKQLGIKLVTRLPAHEPNFLYYQVVGDRDDN